MDKPFNEKPFKEKSWAITTSKARGKHGIGLTGDAQALADELHIPVIDRNNKGIPKLMELYQLDCILVEEEDELIAHWNDGAHLTFHPGMAVPRIKQMKDGELEMLVQVAGIRPGDEILDCTLGMGSDAIVMAFAAGDQGHITSLESSPLIYAITTYGLKHWPTGSWRMKEAMARITTVNSKYEPYLANLAENTCDIVYLDPMFERPIMESSGIAPLRREADYAPLTQETLEYAKRAAKRRVVVKHRAGTLQHLQFDEILGGRYSAIAYGVLYANERK